MTTLVMYMIDVVHEVMKSMKRMVSNTQLILANPPGNLSKSSGKYFKGIGRSLSSATIHVFYVSTLNKRRPRKIVCNRTHIPITYAKISKAFNVTRTTTERYSVAD